MHRTIKIFVVVCVLAAGVGTSLLFRRDAPRNELPEAGNPAAAIPLRAAAPRGPRPLPFELPEEGELPVAADIEEAKTTPVRTVDTSATKSVVRRSPPPLEGVYQPALIEPTVVTVPTTTVPPTAEPRPQRTHRIVDGDSLAKLAQRYLGDRQRGPEIFAANSDVLDNPDILPLGKTLKIPARPAVARPEDDDQ